MKFLFHFYDLHQRAGIQRAICELANALVEDGQEVVVVSNTKRSDVVYPLEQRVVVHQISLPEPDGTGVAVWGKKTVWALRQQWTLREVVKRYQPSIVVDHGTALGLLYPFRTFAGFPFVLQRHFPVQAFPRGKVLYRLLSWISQAKIVVSLTKSIADEMRSYGYRNVVVIPNVLPREAKPSPYSEAVPGTGLLMGRAGNPQKGFDLFLLALAKRQIDGWHYLIVGPGVSVDTQLSELVRRHGLRDQVELMEATTDPYQLIRRAACVIMPSRYEALPMVALEALSIGRPVLASDADGLREIITPGVNGLLFPSGDCDRLSELLSYVRDHPEQLGQLSQRAAESVRQFNASTVVGEWCALTTQLCES